MSYNLYMGDFDDILKKKFNQMGIGRQVEAVGVVEQATKEISKYIPKGDFEVVSFNRGTLKVKVANSVVANEILYHKKDLISGVPAIKFFRTYY